MAKPATIEGREFEVNLNAGDSIQQGGMTITAPRRMTFFLTIPAFTAAYQIDSRGRIVRKFESVGRKAVEAAETG